MNQIEPLNKTLNHGLSEIGNHNQTSNAANKSTNSISQIFNRKNILPKGHLAPCIILNLRTIAVKFFESGIESIIKNEGIERKNFIMSMRKTIPSCAIEPLQYYVKTMQLSGELLQIIQIAISTLNYTLRSMLNNTAHINIRNMILGGYIDAFIDYHISCILTLCFGDRKNRAIREKDDLAKFCIEFANSLTSTVLYGLINKNFKAAITKTLAKSISKNILGLHIWSYLHLSLSK